MSDETTLRPVELAARWEMNPGTLANWRSFGRGPVYQKKGYRVTYKLADILAFEKASEIKPKIETRLSEPRRPAKRRAPRLTAT